MSQWLHNTEIARRRDDVYDGGAFTVSRIGKEWLVWRFTGDDDEKEWIALSAEAMDELRDYFANYYTEDSGEIATQREP